MSTLPQRPLMKQQSALIRLMPEKGHQHMTLQPYITFIANKTQCSEHDLPPGGVIIRLSQ
jgi:hypothetical protein